MPKLTRAYPAYSKHRASGQAVVTLNGTDVYLVSRPRRSLNIEAISNIEFETLCMCCDVRRTSRAGH